jgi:hypothetical protein
MTDRDAHRDQHPRTGERSGVSGVVQYDLDISCYADAHDSGAQMLDTGDISDQGNPILACPDCGRRRAVNVHVRPVGGGTGD